MIQAALGFLVSVAEITPLSDSTRRIPRLNRIILTLLEAVTAGAMFIIPLIFGVFGKPDNSCKEERLTFEECPYGRELQRAQLASVISVNSTFVAA